MKDWIERLLRVTGNDERALKDSLARASRELGFSGYSIYHEEDGIACAISDFDRRFQVTYRDRRYRQIDPILQRAKQSKRAFCWSITSIPRLSAQQKELSEIAAKFGICSGITIPLRSISGALTTFTFASDAYNLDADKKVDYAALAGFAGRLYSRFTLLDGTATCKEDVFLSLKEARYLSWIAAGKSTGETAQIEGVKYNTVRSCIENARKRFGVYSIAHLVALAIRRKLI